jgi:hypothetical protein
MRQVLGDPVTQLAAMILLECQLDATGEGAAAAAGFLHLPLLHLAMQRILAAEAPANLQCCLVAMQNAAATAG